MKYAGCAGKDLPFPIIADEERHLAVKLGMVDPDERTAGGLALTARCVGIVKIIRQIGTKPDVT
jgi:1-Cys peroxiredoxin 6